jgi:hypothetical protein
MNSTQNITNPTYNIQIGFNCIDGLPVTTIVKKYGTNYDFFIVCELLIETMELQIPMKT